MLRRIQIPSGRPRSGTLNCRVEALIKELQRRDTIFTWRFADGVVYFGYHGDTRNPPPWIPIPYGIDDPLLVDYLEWMLAEVNRNR